MVGHGMHNSVVDEFDKKGAIPLEGKISSGKLLPTSVFTMSDHITTLTTDMLVHDSINT